MTLIVRKIYIQTTAIITERLALLKAGPPPSGPRPTAHHPVAWRSGMEVWWPGGPMALSLFSNFFFCPAVNPRACTDLHRVWACRMDDGEFEFVFHFNNHFKSFSIPSFVENNNSLESTSHFQNWHTPKFGKWAISPGQMLCFGKRSVSIIYRRAHLFLNGRLKPWSRNKNAPRFFEACWWLMEGQRLNDAKSRSPTRRAQIILE